MNFGIGTLYLNLVSRNVVHPNYASVVSAQYRNCPKSRNAQANHIAIAKVYEWMDDWLTARTFYKWMIVDT